MNNPNDMMKRISKKLETEDFVEELQSVVLNIVELIMELIKTSNANGLMVANKLNELILEHNEMKATIDKMAAAKANE